MIEFFLPDGSLLGFAQSLVKIENVADGQAPFIGRDVADGGNKPVRIREQQGFGFGIGLARQLKRAEPIRSLGGQFRLRFAPFLKTCSRSYGFGVAAVFVSASAPLSSSSFCLHSAAWSGRLVAS